MGTIASVMVGGGTESCNDGDHNQCDGGIQTAVTMETIASVMVGVQTSVIMETTYYKQLLKYIYLSLS